jgi:hypothetical protein
LTVVGWLVVLSFGANPPHALVATFITLIALGGPASAVGFSLARDYNRPNMVGTAVGVVNGAGFLAAITAAVAIGGVLDLRGSSGGSDFRLAFVSVVLIQVLGVVQIVRWWRRTRAHVLAAQSRGDDTPVVLVAHRWDVGAVKRSRRPRSAGARPHRVSS